MKIGIPKEIKVLEGRVGLIPPAAAELVKRGHEVYIETSAGALSGYEDAHYQALGIQVLPDAASLYATAEMIVKVKEPLEAEVALLREHHLLFSYLHLAAAPELTKQLLDIGLTAVAFETIEDAQGMLPLLAPMSDIAGRISVQAGCHYLHQPLGGKGLLLGGVANAERGHVVILGGGVAGMGAAIMAGAMGAQITVFDPNRTKLEAARALGDNVTGLPPYEALITQAVLSADLLIGAVLLPGERAPHLVSGATVKQMRPGSVIVDISVDQGGCIETTQPTTYANPTFEWEGVLHFGVTNMPGAVPKTASQALSAALVDYVGQLAEPGWERRPGLQKGVNVRQGKIVHPGLLKSLSDL